MKKVFSIILSLVMILSLVGCENSKTNTKEKSQDEAATKTEESTTHAAENNTTEKSSNGEPVYINPNASEMKGTVRFWTAFADSYGTGDLIKEFNKYYPNIKVESNVYSNNTEGNLTCDTAMMSGELDALLSFGAFNTASRWENDMFYDITDKLAADNLDLVKEWGSDAYRYKDRTYVIPSGGLSVFVALNMTKWNAAGMGEIPDEWTWDEYIDACDKLTERDSSGNVEVYGGTDFNQRDYWTYALRQTKGVDAFYKEDGTADFDNPLCETIFKRYQDCEDKGIWYKKMTLITDGQKSRDLLWNGKVASCVESIITRFVSDTEKYPHDFILGYAPYPVNNKGEVNYAQGNMPNSFFAVTKNAQDPDAAYEFIKFASTYGGKYLYKAGHTTTWTGINPDEIVNLVFGSKEEAAKWVDVDSYVKNVIAVGAPAYHEENIVAYSEIQNLLNEYTDYILNRSLPIKDGLNELNNLANEAIKEKISNN